MLGVISFIAFICTILAAVTLWSNKASRIDKLLAGTVCILAGIFTILAYILQQKFVKDYIAYSTSWRGGCIVYRKEICKDVPFYFDKCRVIKAETVCPNPPEWFYEER